MKQQLPGRLFVTEVPDYGSVVGLRGYAINSNPPRIPYIARVVRHEPEKDLFYARLFAAAPEMFLALEKALKSLEYAAHALQVPVFSEMRENIDVMKQALARAKGEDGE